MGKQTQIQIIVYRNQSSRASLGINSYGLTARIVSLIRSGTLLG